MTAKLLIIYEKKQQIMYQSLFFLYYAFYFIGYKTKTSPVRRMYVFFLVMFCLYEMM